MNHETKANNLLAAAAARHGWDAETAVDLICAYADLQDEFLSTPSLPGTRPPSFADFLADVEAAFAARVVGRAAGEDASEPLPITEAG